MCLWVRNRTTAPIYIWGHSLGSALAAETAAHLSNQNFNLSGLILESAFTSLREELYVHPYGKVSGHFEIEYLFCIFSANRIDRYVNGV